MLVGMIFLHLFGKFYKNVLPALGGKHIFEERFCKYHVQEDVSIPNLASKPPLMGGHFPIVLCKK